MASIVCRLMPPVQCWRNNLECAEPARAYALVLYSPILPAERPLMIDRLRDPNPGTVRDPGGNAA